MKRSTTLLIVGESLNAFDFIITNYLIFIHNWYELNPVMRFIINRFGFQGFAVSKVVCAVLMIVLYWIWQKTNINRR